MSGLLRTLWERGLPAMVANDNAGCLMPRGVLGSIASKLAPTGDSEGSYALLN